ncbi:MAG: bifunctional YncE family protein/alkaline phosphatase family protein [Acidobacteriia bacterium]|nr:bifunctional YncE family protein/alkaline phosphatase family protein [Terriglobia bacterium]
MPAAWRSSLTLLTLSTILTAQTYSAPAGIRPALRRSGASILPGGRIIAPLGDQYVTGPGAFGLAVSSSGKTAVTSNGGPGRNSLTVLDRDKNGRWQARQLMARSLDMLDEFEDADWRSVFMGLAFSSEHAVFASEGNSGKISLFDWNADRRRVIDLNQGGFDDSYTGDLALDAERGILYAVDQANFRVAVIETKSRQILTSVKVGRLPFALALSPDRQKLYVTNVGMFQYQSIPGADPKQARTTGLSFPAFGFPSAEASAGAERQTAKGVVQVPGLGDPNVRESNSVCVIDVSNPAAAKVETFIRTGLPFGENSQGGSSPSGVVAAADNIFVSNASNDSITVIDGKTNTVAAEIPIRIPGMEPLRGVLPIGMAYHEKSGWLLVAEAGINAVGVIDTRERRVLGHLPMAWFPTRVAIDHDTIFVANAKGHGRGPNAPGGPPGALLPSHLRQGSLSVFPLPKAEDLPQQTAFVLEANGFHPSTTALPPLPSGIRHVILIVKENRTYDEVFGDLQSASNGAAMGSPEIARLGTRGYVDGKGKRFSLKDVNVTPNHHAIARRWTFSDNFYADSDVSVDGHHWLVGAYPNAWTESSLMAAYSDQKKDFRLGAAPGRLLFAGSDSSVHPEEQTEGGTIWHHLTRHGVSFYNFGEGFELAGVDEGKDLEPTGARFLTNVPMPDPLYRHTSRQYPGFNMNIPDQYRASQFIREMDEKYVKGGEEMPRFLFMHLPNDHMAKERPEDGYPYEESFVADNDYALGRILEYLSGTKWWNETAVFITEDDAQGGVDHIDAQRTVLLCAGPWCRKDYVSHVNTSFPGLLKTIFRLLDVPALNLFDAAASDLSDCLASRPDPVPYKAVDVDLRIFDPAAAKESRSGVPGPRMDAPRDK